MYDFQVCHSSTDTNTNFTSLIRDEDGGAKIIFSQVIEALNYFDRNCGSFGCDCLSTSGIDLKHIFMSKMFSFVCLF